MSATVQPVRGLNSDGSVDVTVVGGGGSGGTSSTFGAAFPATGTAAGFIDASGNMAGANLDASGFLKVNVAAGSGGNAAASATGAAVPASADYQGINVSGTLRGATGVNPSGSIYAQQVDIASLVGTTADTNSGLKSAGTLRVVLATDQPQLTNSLIVSQATATNLKTQAEAYQGGSAVAAGNPLQVTLANGVVPSHAVTNAGTFAVQESGAALTALQLIDDGVYTDDTSTHTTGTSKGYGIMAVATPTDASINANDFGHVAMTVDRKLHVAVMDALPAGTNAIGKLAANSGVDIGDVDVTSIIPGTGASNLGKAEDAGHTSADVGVMLLAVRDDSPDAARADADNDYVPIAVTSTGAVRIAPISEDFAVLANGPQTKKYYTNAGAVTDGIVWSPAAGKRWYVTDIIVNVSAAATVTFEDDKAGGDEVVAKFEFAANSGIVHGFNTPWFSGEDAADLLVTTSAGNIYITITGYEI